MAELDVGWTALPRSTNAVLKHAESFLNIGDEEMRPIEAEPALIGRYPLQR